MSALAATEAVEQAGFWNEIFEPAGDARKSSEVRLRVLKKSRRPFLFLPRNARAARATLALYPAQTRRARMLQRCLRWLLSSPLAQSLPEVSFSIGENDALLNFLHSVGGAAGGERLEFGVLAGNEATPGRRFVLLVFDGKHEPRVVIKAGSTEAARQLLKAEAGFLNEAAKMPYLPALLGQFESERTAGLGLKYVSGRPALESDENKVPQVLSAWVGSSAPVLIGQTEPWLALERRVGREPFFARLNERVRGLSVPPTIQHGDFTPWNVRVTDSGEWTVLDWERGQRAGIPGWDWLHYVIQPAILVKHRSAEEILPTIEKLFQSQEFQVYAARAGIMGRERELLAAYLLHMVEVVRPTEGLAETTELMRVVLGRLRADKT